MPTTQGYRATQNLCSLTVNYPELVMCYPANYNPVMHWTRKKCSTQCCGGRHEWWPMAQMTFTLFIQKSIWPTEHYINWPFFPVLLVLQNAEVLMILMAKTRREKNTNQLSCHVILLKWELRFSAAFHQLSTPFIISRNKKRRSSFKYSPWPSETLELTNFAVLFRGQKEVFS